MLAMAGTRYGWIAILAIHVSGRGVLFTSFAVSDQDEVLFHH